MLVYTSIKKTLKFYACGLKFLKKVFEPKPVTLTVPKKQLFIVLPFMGNMSGVIKTGLSKALQKTSPFS